jgi:hypothetical protein
MKGLLRTTAWLRLTLVLLQSGAIPAQTVPVPPPPRMNIVVVEGEAAIHNIRERKAADVAVVVRDGNRKPVSGASVTFTLPADGPSAVFANGTRIQTVQTDDNGHAAVRGIRPNGIPGTYRIQVEARSDAQTASGVVTQYNMAVAAKQKSGKWLVILAVAGAAVAGGVVAGVRSGSSGSSTPSAIIGISPGTAAVGAPR